MYFEWDGAKSDANLHRRGFGFDYAALIFLGRPLINRDDRVDYGEVRMNAIGPIEGDLDHVTYTDRGGVRRIISARRAHRKERRQWYASV